AALPVSQAHANQRTHTIAVFGDSLARELWNGVRYAVRKHRNVKVLRKAKSGTGLVRTDRYDWQAKVRAAVRRQRIDTAIVLFGGNDRQTMRTRQGRLKRFTAPWLAEYARRVDAFTSVLVNAGVKVYWVGIPIVESRRMARDYQKLNRVFAARAAANGIIYLDTWQDFKGPDGKFAVYGRTLGGRTRKLRDEDGLHFTVAGAYVFGNLIARRISRRERVAMQD
ncbi:MAG: DUF459 domain-containing protein, partial [Pseudomonadota bacterium]